MADVKLKSQAMAMSLGVQSAKDVAATDFQTGLLLNSVVPVPDWDVIENRAEHPSAVLGRSATKASVSERVGYIVPIGSGGFLYPRYFPMLLIGAGFECVSTDETGYYQHVLTMANDDAMKWLTALYDISTLKTVRVLNSRFSNVTLTATPDDIQFSGEGAGLVTGDALGTEVKVAELKTKILPTLPTTGGWSFSIGGTELSANRVRGFTATIGQTLDDEDKSLWAVTRADLARDSIGVTGTATGINLDADIFEKAWYGGVGGSAPDLAPVEVDITTLWESSSEVDTGVPYSVKMEVPKAELTGEVADANESDTILFSFNWAMVDDSADPITFTIINDVESYY